MRFMIGKIIKTMRRKAGLTQEQIGKVCGFARNTISQYETGTLQPDFNTIEKIANECGYRITFINTKLKNELNTQNIDREEV